MGMRAGLLAGSMGKIISGWPSIYLLPYFDNAEASRMDGQPKL